MDAWMVALGMLLTALVSVIVGDVVLLKRGRRLPSRTVLAGMAAQVLTALTVAWVDGAPVAAMWAIPLVMFSMIAIYWLAIRPSLMDS